MKDGKTRKTLTSIYADNQVQHVTLMDIYKHIADIDLLQTHFMSKQVYVPRTQ